jgi:hypothetical protein
MKKSLCIFIILLSGCVNQLSVVDAPIEETSGNETENSEQEQFCLTIDVKAYLRGSYDTATGLMSTGLSDNYLLPGLDQTTNPNAPNPTGVSTPVGQPYNVAPWLHNGDEGDHLSDQGGTVVSPYPDGTVDWILISLRQGGINKSDEVFMEAFLLMEDGTIFKTSDSCFQPEELNNYYIVVDH